MILPEKENFHKNHHHHHHVSFWLSNGMKDEARSEEGNKAMATNTTIIENKIGGVARNNSDTTKKTCLCSPTTHAGSFRCRLHRTTNNNCSQNWPPISSSHNNNNNNNNNNNITESSSGQPRLSRFGRRASCDKMHFTVASSTTPEQVQ